MPAGTPCAIRNVLAGPDEWYPFVTRQDNRFDRFARWHKEPEGDYYEFRAGVWVMLVRSHFVEEWR